MVPYQHVIVGSGLIGCFLGGIIGQSARVALVGRQTWLARLKAGITLTDYTGGEAPFKASEDQCWSTLPERLDHSVIWLTVKNTALAEVLEQLRPVLGSDCLVVCCQNGLGGATLARQYLPDVSVLQAIVGCNVVWDDTHQRLHKATEGAFYLEQLTGITDQQSAALRMVQHRLLTLCVREDIEAVAWAKLQLNLANSINAIVNQPVRTMLLDRGCRQVIAALMDELLAVTAQLPVRLPKLTRVPANWLPFMLRLPDWLFTRLASAMLHIEPDARSSMWWDLQAGRLTEIDYLNGAVTAQGKLAGVDCPLNDSVIALVKSLETSTLVASRRPLDGNTLKFQLHLK
ncbi:2-dehydropantoate 2-reductase [uncultured Alteromonas sp.]|jgi:2-dehydropantoate 2-reductase|uniref:2-dehydropantoate 2-reductase n=1 Tax=uncultured Alteromonas sp. TaxID=179113 RepID=UPI0025FB1E6A|nr:2-dehydropantoate 2-reductase [uncultured Alteromonas sp.]